MDFHVNPHARRSRRCAPTAMISLPRCETNKKKKGHRERERIADAKKRIKEEALNRPDAPSDMDVVAKTRGGPR